MTLNDLIVWS